MVTAKKINGIIYYLGRAAEVRKATSSFKTMLSVQFSERYPRDIEKCLAVVAVANDTIVGVWKFIRRHEKLYSYLTVVDFHFRKQKIAATMWSLGLTTFKAKEVKVTLVTDRGKTLVSAISGRFPKIKWGLKEIGGRPLRDLR